MFLSKFKGLPIVNYMVLSISKSVIVMILSVFDEKTVFLMVLSLTDIPFMMF